MKKIELCLLMVVCFLVANGQEEISKIENAHAGQVLSIALTSDASRILTGGSDGKSHIWDLKAGTKWKSFSGQAAGVAFNSSNKIFVTGGSDKRMIVWDAELGKPKKILKCESEITCVAFNPVNDNIACGYIDGKATIWNAEAGSLIATMEGHKQSINGLCFSPDGKQLVTGSLDNTVKFWDVSNGKLTNTVDPGVKGITDVKYSPDGKFIAGGGENNAVFFLDAGSGNLIADHTEHKGKVNAVAFSPDVQYLASGGDDGKIIIWDVQTRQTVKNFEAHAGGLTDLVIGDRGLVLVSAGNDGDIRVWDIEGLNIGKKKFTIGVQKPKLICSSLDLDDKNGNGIIEFDDKASLVFSIWNEGKGVAYDVVVEVISTGVKGMTFDKEFFLGNLSGNKKQNVKIPLYISQEMETSSGTFTVKVKEANSFNPDPITLAFQTKGGEAYTYIMVTDYKYSSGTGKAEQGAPITLKLKLQNTSTQTAKDLKISYGFPNEVMAVDKLSESIPVLQPGEMKEVSVEFYASEKFTGSKLDVKVNIEGAKYSNLKDINLAITMNELLPVSNLAIAQAEPGDQPIYRGGGDPLKGLNISRAQTMQAGKYYALIIAIDKYSGTWNPLKNAVNDAKAVETLLKEKYRFDIFRRLHDEAATRENIIKEMEWLVANIRPEDNLFVYYSGHGEFKQELNKGYWVPVDANTASVSKYISNSDIQTFLGGIKSKHTLLVSDACFSGDIFRGGTVMIPFEDSEKYYKDVYELPSRKAITSGGIEPVMDGGREGHSVFAYYFLKILDNNNNKYFDAGQLYDKIKVPVTNNSEQSPKFSPIKDAGDEGGQFIFIKK